jgi:hypothetical protein
VEVGMLVSGEAPACASEFEDCPHPNSSKLLSMTAADVVRTGLNTLSPFRVSMRRCFGPSRSSCTS